jgi:hypothetical protein
VCPGLAHRTVRCATGQCPVHQGTRLRTCHLREFWEPLRYNSPDCPVHQRSNGYTAPTVICNGTVKRYSARLRAQKSEQAPEGAPDCPVRHATEALTNGHFGGWGYKYPQPPTIHCIQVFSLQTSYKSSRLHSKTQTRDQILSQVQRSFQSNSD